MRRGVAKSCKGRSVSTGQRNVFGRFITTNFMVRLGRRNNELTNFLGARGTGAKDDNEFYNWPRTAEQRIKRINEFLGRRGTGAKHCSSLCSQSEGDGYVANLSEIYCGLCGAAAPERGSYSRIGARPYLPPVLSDSRCCPCKGRISLAGLAPQ